MINFLGILFAITKMNLIIYFYETNRLYIIHFFNSSFLCSRKKTHTTGSVSIPEVLFEGTYSGYLEPITSGGLKEVLPMVLCIIILM